VLYLLKVYALVAAFVFGLSSVIIVVLFFATLSRIREFFRDGSAYLRSFRAKSNDLVIGSAFAIGFGSKQRRFQTMSRSIISKRGAGGFLAVIVALFVFTTTGMAQVELPSQINFQGTGLVTKDTTEGTNSHSATKSGGFLLGYSYQFNRWAGVEGNYGYTRNTQNYFGLTSGPSIEADFHEITGAFVAHFPLNVSKVRPYALAGTGALVFEPTNKFVVTGAGRQTKAAFLYGGGVNFDLAHNFGVRAEYRGLVYKVPDFTLTGLNLDKVTHLAQPSVGFYFRF
jgi:opacity protein-like surface antigen